MKWLTQLVCVAMSVVPDHRGAIARCQEELRPDGVLSICDAGLFRGPWPSSTLRSERCSCALLAGIRNTTFPRRCARSSAMCAWRHSTREASSLRPQERRCESDTDQDRKGRAGACTQERERDRTPTIRPNRTQGSGAFEVTAMTVASSYYRCSAVAEGQRLSTHIVNESTLFLPVPGRVSLVQFDRSGDGGHRLPPR